MNVEPQIVNEILAIPVFQKRVSPVFDSCTRIWVVEFSETGTETRSQLPVTRLNLEEKILLIDKMDVMTLICGVASRMALHLLAQTPIRVIIGVAGDVEGVIRAYREDRLAEPQYCLPGFFRSKPC